MVTTPVQVWIGGQQADPAKVPYPITVTHGRSGVGQQPDPPSAELEWLDPVCPYRLGDRVDILGGIEYTPARYDDPNITYDDPRAVYDSGPDPDAVYTARFVGSIDALEADATLGMVVGWRISAVGLQARAGVTRVQLVNRPAENDVARVRAIAPGIRVVGAPGITLAAAALIDTDVLTALNDVAESTGGLVWQTTDGVLTYGTADHRRSSYPLGVLPAGDIDSTLMWAQNTEDIVNDVTVTWGPADARQSETHKDLESQSQAWGVRHVDVASQAAAEPDAEALALLILGRRAFPYWGTPSTLLTAGGLTTAEARLVAALDVSAQVLAPIPATPGPTPVDPVAATVEGWVEVWEETEYLMQLALSDTARWVATGTRTYTEVAARWATYADLAAGGSYLNILIEEG